MSMPTGLGVDLHPYYQRGVTALPGVEYGWLKMCDGAARYTKKLGTTLYTADAHAALFRRLGVPFSGYVYAQPGDGAAEARVLWAECQRLGGTGVAPGCDLESNKDIHIWSAAEAKDHGRAYASQMRKLGVRPAIYGDLDLLQAIDPTSWPEDPVVWAPRYGRKPEADGKYTRGYDVHQYDDAGALPGSAGPVDWNQSYRRGTTTTPGTAHLTNSTEDDMPLTQADAVTIFWGTPFDGKDNFAQYLKGHIAAIEAGQSALLAAVAAATKDPAISVDTLKQIVNDAVAQHVQITGTVQVGPAPAANAEAAQ
jgi:hypothetical protein